jgi:hypothetical protein
MPCPSAVLSWVSLLPVLLTAVPGAAISGEGRLADDFGGGLGPAVWSVSQSTAGYFTVDATQGRVRLETAALPNPGGLQGVFGNLSPVLLGGRVSGDFSLQIDFAAARITGPGLNQVQLHAFFEDGVFFTVYDNSCGTNAHVWNGGSVQGRRPVSGDSGTFRISRTGSAVTSFFDDIPLAVENRPTALLGIAFCLQNNPGSSDAIAVTFDNFSLTAPSVPPVLSMASPAPGTVRLGWAAGSVGYLLEQSAELTSPVWQPVTTLPSFDGSSFFLDRGAGTPRQFFRMRRY